MPGWLRWWSVPNPRVQRADESHLLQRPRHPVCGQCWRVHMQGLQPRLHRAAVRSELLLWENRQKPLQRPRRTPGRSDYMQVCLPQRVQRRPVRAGRKTNTPATSCAARILLHTRPSDSVHPPCHLLCTDDQPHVLADSYRKRARRTGVDHRALPRRRPAEFQRAGCWSSWPWTQYDRRRAGAHSRTVRVTLSATHRRRLRVLQFQRQCRRRRKPEVLAVRRSCRYDPGFQDPAVDTPHPQHRVQAATDPSYCCQHNRSTHSGRCRLSVPRLRHH